MFLIQSATDRNNDDHPIMQSAIPRGEKPLCLNNLAASVMKFIKAAQVTTFQDVADGLILEVSRFPRENKGEKTTSRRVYYVLNVFLAPGLIERSRKSIRFCLPWGGTDGETADSDEVRRGVSACEAKQQLLNDKIKLLAAYKGLVTGNSAVQRPRSAIKLPSIIVGFDMNISGVRSHRLAVGDSKFDCRGSRCSIPRWTY
jgi:hypothetical protein